MKKALFTLLISFVALIVTAQNAGDTIIIPTINYSQTQSLNGRDTMIDFPNVINQKYEKILMMYNMRCKDGLVSNSNNTNLGCGEGSVQ